MKKQSKPHMARDVKADSAQADLLIALSNLEKVAAESRQRLENIPMERARTIFKAHELMRLQQAISDELLCTVLLPLCNVSGGIRVDRDAQVDPANQYPLSVYRRAWADALLAGLDILAGEVGIYRGVMYATEAVVAKRLLNALSGHEITQTVGHYQMVNGLAQIPVTTIVQTPNGDRLRQSLHPILVRPGDSAARLETLAKRRAVQDWAQQSGTSSSVEPNPDDAGWSTEAATAHAAAEGPQEPVTVEATRPSRRKR